eukprot:365820-Chlamydomonas_euryale.AAC.1
MARVGAPRRMVWERTENYFRGKSTQKAQGPIPWIRRPRGLFHGSEGSGAYSMDQKAQGPIPWSRRLRGLFHGAEGSGAYSMEQKAQGPIPWGPIPWSRRLRGLFHGSEGPGAYSMEQKAQGPIPWSRRLRGLFHGAEGSGAYSMEQKAQGPIPWSERALSALCGACTHKRPAGLWRALPLQAELRVSTSKVVWQLHLVGTVISSRVINKRQQICVLNMPKSAYGHDRLMSVEPIAASFLVSRRTKRRHRRAQTGPHERRRALLASRLSLVFYTWLLPAAGMMKSFPRCQPVCQPHEVRDVATPSLLLGKGGRRPPLSWSPGPTQCERRSFDLYVVGPLEQRHTSTCCASSHLNPFVMPTHHRGPQRGPHQHACTHVHARDAATAGAAATARAADAGGWRVRACGGAPHFGARWAAPACAVDAHRARAPPYPGGSPLSCIHARTCLHT